MASEPDVVVVGSGPNGLAAGVTLARAGLEVEIREVAGEIGGGLRSAELFEAGVVHDVCSAVHPMAVAGKFFREFDLEARGVGFAQPEVAFGQPLDAGRAGLAYSNLERTCDGLGRDGDKWRRVMGPLVDRSRDVVDTMFSDLRRPPESLVAAAELAARVGPWMNRVFETDEARGLLAGVAAHSFGRLPSLPGGAISMLLGHLAHSSGWPIPKGGSRRIADALADDFLAHQGVLHTGSPVTDIRELAKVRAVVLDIGPKGFLDIARDVMPDGYARKLENYRYGPGAAKVDFLVSEPIPWANEELGKAGTAHIGGSAAEVYAAENAVADGKRAEEPFVLLSEPMVVDSSRGQEKKRPVWAYCHVPNGDDLDPVDTVTRRIERYAPGFSETVLESRGVSARELGAYNPNYVGGDIGAGKIDLGQLFARPVPQWDPYRTALGGVYLCSAATPPGPGVHGMSGYFAARTVLRREFGVREMPDLAP